MSNNITWHEHKISRGEREQLNGHKGCVIWFTGLSGSGKSTVANVVEQKLYERASAATCWTATTSATGSTPARICSRSGTDPSSPSGSDWDSPPRTARRTSAGSARWRSCSARPASSR